jgi:hypothetical protein
MPTHENHIQPATKRQTRDNERNEAIASLKEWLKPSTVVYTVLRSVSSSGISRTLDLYVVLNHEMVRITWSTAKVLEWTYDRRKEALRVNGCGMDMGYHAVHCLSRVILGMATH